MPPEVLEYKARCYESTALHFAIMYGNLKAAEVMVNKNRMLTQIRNCDGRAPLALALMYTTGAQKEIPSPFSGHAGASLLLCDAIDEEFYDIASSLVLRFPGLVSTRSKWSKHYGFEILVEKPFTFLSGTRLTWSNPSQSIIGANNEDAGNPSKSSKGMEGNEKVPHFKQSYKQKLMHKQALALVQNMLRQLDETLNRKEIIEFFESSTFMKTAIKHGFTEFIMASLHEISGQTMAQTAVEERNDTILNCLCETADIMGRKTDLVSKDDKSYNTLLHYAAKLVSGAALQMQRELQWFKGVERILRSKNRYRTHGDGNTAQLIFTEEHKGLLEKDEKWMKDTSGSCMVVAALIIIICIILMLFLVEK
ncbi:hypothetical protein MKX01_028187 [Papaver californicum]|nr:hypothetical protein MKX01_028187 [Papaver californicum]